MLELRCHKIGLLGRHTVEPMIDVEMELAICSRLQLNRDWILLELAKVAGWLAVTYVNRKIVVQKGYQACFGHGRTLLESEDRIE